MAVSSSETGRLGEELALAHLKKRGFVLLEKNYRAGRQEIDLIMRDGQTLVFVEVKARSRTDYGVPAEAVGLAKRKNLIRAAETYLIQNGLTDAPARFDVAEVYLKTHTVHLIENAF